MINHYSGAGEAISWTSEEEGKKWARNIPGIDGALSATQKNAETPILQLHDLEGDIVATAADNETETKLLTTYNSTEFGVQANGKPPTKYSWLGAGGLATEQSSGAANPGGSSYVTQLGRPLQTQPVEAPGAYSNGSYGGAPYTTEISAQAITLGNDWAAGAPEREAARQAAAKKREEEEEERAKEQAELNARLNAPTPTEGGAEGGDPVVCDAVAKSPEKAGNGKLRITGGYECHGPLWETDQVNAIVEVCAEVWNERAGGWLEVEGSCHIHTFLAAGSAGGQETISCKPGHHYLTWVWVYVWGLDEKWVRDPTEDESKEVTCS